SNSRIVTKLQVIDPLSQSDRACNPLHHWTLLSVGPLSAPAACRARHWSKLRWRLSLAVQQGRRTRIAGSEDDIRLERDQFRRIGAKAIGIARGPAGLDLHVAPDSPARLLQTLQKYPVARLSERIVGNKVMEHADAPHDRSLSSSMRALASRPTGARPHSRSRPFRKPGAKNSDYLNWFWPLAFPGAGTPAPGSRGGQVTVIMGRHKTLSEAAR